MENKTKLDFLKELKVHLNWIGVWRIDSSVRERNVSVLKNCVMLSAFVSYFMSTGWFRLFFAQTIREITESSFFTLAALLFIVWYSILILKRNEYAAIFDELNEKIGQSK